MSSAQDSVQALFARLLSWLVRIGLALMFVSFILYVFGLVPSGIPVALVQDQWAHSADEFAAATGMQTGWNWVRDLLDGRALAFASLVIFPAGTIILTAAASLLYLRHKDKRYALIAALECVVLVVAATGLLSTGH